MNEHSAQQPTLLIVEDEVKLARVLAQYLEREQFHTQIMERGDQALEWLGQHRAQLILLDLMLPGMDGISLCKAVRQTSQVPIIMTTARVEEIDRLIGLELGADDYICKPYSPREVVARVKAVLRRSPSGQAPQSEPDLQLQSQSNRVQWIQSDGSANSVELTAVEMRLLQALMQGAGRIYSRDQLMDVIYPDQRLVNDRTVDSHIKNLRKKLHQLAPEREFVRSVYGAGYRFE